jgi:hypothetical protein
MEGFMKTTEEYEEMLLNNAQISAEIMKKYLKGEISGNEKVRVAHQSITQYQRFMATRGVFDTLKVQIGSLITKDQKELKEHIKRQLPEFL